MLQISHNGLDPDKPGATLTFTDKENGINLTVPWYEHDPINAISVGGTEYHHDDPCLSFHPEPTITVIARPETREMVYIQHGVSFAPSVVYMNGVKQIAMQAIYASHPRTQITAEVSEYDLGKEEFKSHSRGRLSGWDGFAEKMNTLGHVLAALRLRAERPGPAAPETEGRPLQP